MEAKNQKKNESSGDTTPVVDREKVKAEREAKKLAKQAAKQKLQDKNRNLTPNESQTNEVNKPEKVQQKQNEKQKPVDNKKKEKEPQKIQLPVKAVEVTEKLSKLEISRKSENAEVGEKKQVTKAERRAIQEAQRAKKAGKIPVKSDASTSGKQQQQQQKLTPPSPTTEKVPKSISPGPQSASKSASASSSALLHRVKLFNHLYTDRALQSHKTLNSSVVHPAVVRLGTQYTNLIVKGANARVLAFMNAIKSVIEDYETPAQKVFSRGLDETIDIARNYLDKCRPIAVSVTNGIKFIKWQINQLPKNETESVQKTILLDSIDTYIRDQLDKATEAISIQVQEKISDGDVILTFGCSSVVQNILDEAKKSKRDFSVIVVDARPWHEGQEMLRRLTAKNIKCTCVLINAVGFIMPQVTKVLLGAHALLANGYVMSRAGTAQVALIAKSYNVPVLVCCETHKFSERVLTDAFVYNEIGMRITLFISVQMIIIFNQIFLR